MRCSRIRNVSFIQNVHWHYRYKFKIWTVRIRYSSYDSGQKKNGDFRRQFVKNCLTIYTTVHIILLFVCTYVNCNNTYRSDQLESVFAVFAYTIYIPDLTWPQMNWIDKCTISVSVNNYYHTHRPTAYRWNQFSRCIQSRSRRPELWYRWIRSACWKLRPTSKGLSPLRCRRQMCSPHCRWAL